MKTGRNHNPFAVQYLGPENIEYQFAEGDSLGAVMARIEAARWRASLVGPHGAGKSTLLRTIRRAAHDLGRKTVLFQCSDQRRFLPLGWIGAVLSNDVVFLDGGERLFPPQGLLLRLLCRLSGRGLLQTIHVPGSWGDQVAVTASARQLHTVVERVAAPIGVTLSPAETARRLRESQGDAREALFALYHDYEHGALGPAFPLNNPPRKCKPTINQTTNGARHDAG